MSNKNHQYVSLNFCFKCGIVTTATITDTNTDIWRVKLRLMPELIVLYVNS